MLSSTDLEEVVQAAIDWYREMKLELMRTIEADHPYGSVRLTPAEQLGQYLAMTPESWQAKMAALDRRFRGFPNKAKLVEDELTRYITHMETIRSQMASVLPVGSTTEGV